MLPPAFLDSSTGRYSSFETSCRFHFRYNNMHSSSSNPNNGFSNFNETNPILGFNSPPLVASRKPGAGAPGTSGSSLSRPRLLKVRKQTSSHNLKSSNPLDTRVAGADRGVGFDQFRSSSEPVLGNMTSGNVAKETFVFGVNGANNSSSSWDLDKGVSSVNSNGILEDMSKLKINSDNDYANATESNAAFNLEESVVDRLMAEELPNDISKLKIEGASNTGSLKNSQGVDLINKSQFTDLSNVAAELQNEMKRMNLKDPTDISSESGFQSFGIASSTSRSEKMAAFAFTSKLDDIGAPHVEFKTPDMKSNIFSGLDGFNAKKESVKDTRLKKKKGKLKTPIVGQSRLREDFGFIGRGLSENLDTYEAYSPMDISPYDEKLADNYSRETSVTSEEASQINDQNNMSSESLIMTSYVTTDDEVFEPHINEVSETESFKSATENLEYSSDTFVTALDTDESSTATSGRQESEATQFFSFGSRVENASNGSFTFAASSSSQSQLPLDTRQRKNKLPIKFVLDSYGSTSADFFPISGNSSILSPGKGQKVDLSTSTSQKKANMNLVNEQNFRHETYSTLSSSKLTEEACEKWRLRGNQAYSNGDLAKAEDCYTQGINSVSQNEKSRSCLRALMLCYSNRAATRISLGRMKAALGDCLMAATIDPSFLKVQIRAANCYLAMGEIENAEKQYMKCLQFGNDNTVDKKVIAEASEGLEKAQKVSDCIKQCTDLYQRRASEDLECALRVINEALQISTCSEKLLQMKADTLFMLRRYEQVIQVCEQTLTSDEADTTTSSSSMLWKPRLIVKSYFYLGRLDEALEFIKKQDISERTTERCQESEIPLVDTIRELLSCKTVGNEAYKSGKHAEAVEHYTTALSCNVESRPFASVCFCNRAAAYSALGQIIDAIADCSLAIALDPNYFKAISRRASLYEMIRDYGQAAIDLQRLVSLLTTQVEENTALSGVPDKLSRISELKQIQVQLSSVEEKSKTGIPLNMYIILGVESTASAADIKKAYRKAALRHHPDKAAQSLGRSDDGDDGLWKDIVENVHKDADRIFKMIGEAYAVLSNPSKRSQYDQDEERRNEASRFTRSNSSRMAADVQNSIFERSGSRRQWPDSWRPNVNTQSSGSENTSSSYRYSRYY